MVGSKYRRLTVNKHECETLRTCNMWSRKTMWPGCVTRKATAIHVSHTPRVASLVHICKWHTPHHTQPLCVKAYLVVHVTVLLQLPQHRRHVNCTGTVLLFVHILLRPVLPVVPIQQGLLLPRKLLPRQLYQHRRRTAARARRWPANLLWSQCAIRARLLWLTPANEQAGAGGEGGCMGGQRVWTTVVLVHGEGDRERAGRL